MAGAWLVLSLLQIWRPWLRLNFCLLQRVGLSRFPCLVASYLSGRVPFTRRTMERTVWFRRVGNVILESNGIGWSMTGSVPDPDLASAVETQLLFSTARRSWPRPTALEVRTRVSFPPWYPVKPPSLPRIGVQRSRLNFPSVQNSAILGLILTLCQVATPLSCFCSFIVDQANVMWQCCRTIRNPPSRTHNRLPQSH
ncbi:hypothetical protein BJX99DRAFT_51075 [Aspergillus californicus]